MGPIIWILEKINYQVTLLILHFVIKWRKGDVLLMPKLIANKQTNPKTRINKIISEKSIIIEDMVKVTGITQSAMSMLLTGQRKISLSQIISIADYIDCSIDYLLYRD